MKIAGVTKDGSSLSANQLSYETSLNREDFVKSLALELRFVLYGKYPFKNEEVTRIEMRVRNEEPMLHVNYELRMERTDVSIANENPIPQEKRLSFGPYQGTVLPEWSTIEGKIFNIQCVPKKSTPYNSLLSR